MRTRTRFFTKNTIIAICALAILATAAALMLTTKGAEKSEMENKFSDVDFQDVSENSYMSYKCSPESENLDFLGLLINAPKIVTYVPGYSDPINGAWARVIVCGHYSFKYTTLGLNGDFADAITIIAIDEKTQATFRGRMSGIVNEIPRPQSDAKEQNLEDYSGDTIGGYFNPNLASIMGLPEQEADYVVYAQLGNYESNRVKISIRKSEH